MNAGLDVDKDVLPPQRIDDLRPRDEPLPVGDQQDQKIHRLAFEPNGPPVAAKLIARDIEVEVQEAKELRWIGWGHPSSAGVTMTQLH